MWSLLILATLISLIFIYFIIKCSKDENFSNLSENLYQFTNHEFEDPNNLFLPNSIAYTHPSTNWAVCDSYIKTKNNKIISKLIELHAKEMNQNLFKYKNEV